MNEARYLPLGDSAITVILGEGISRSLSGEVLRVVNALRDATLDGVDEIVPSYASLGVYYDPLRAGFDDLLDAIRPVVTRARTAPSEETQAPERTIRIPVRYDGEDLAEIAERTGQSVAHVVRLHSEREYYVFVIGFVPGFAYLGEIDPALVLPRRSAPRKRVPPGSVAIAETQTGIYPFATPGGWNLIGTTDMRMFDARRSDPALLRVGDRVIFQPKS